MSDLFFDLDTNLTIAGSLRQATIYEPGLDACSPTRHTRTLAYAACVHMNKQRRTDVRTSRVLYTRHF